MTLKELSVQYRYSAQLLAVRLRELRLLEKCVCDPEQLFRLGRRKAMLTQMLLEMNELAELTEHYYERRYHRNEKYTL